MKLLPWLKFFRIVNLPTVPGDVLVGAGAVVAFSSHAAGMPRLLCSAASCCSAVVWAVVASCALYLYGLADNDIVGAKNDGSERPIPAGEISMGAARIARALCLLVALVAGSLGGLTTPWWICAFVLFGLMLTYNRSRGCLAMGLCRGANVACGAAAALSSHATGVSRPLCVALGVASVWTIYIWAVTKYSEGEDADPAKRQRVGFLIGAIVYLQLGALLAVYMSTPAVWSRNLLLVGAGLLILLRLMKRAFPKVSAS